MGWLRRRRPADRWVCHLDPLPDGDRVVPEGRTRTTELLGAAGPAIAEEAALSTPAQWWRANGGVS